MEVIVTDHARYRMARRHITPEMVRQTIEQPATRGIGYGGRQLAFKVFTEGTVKVVYVVEGSVSVIITAMWHYPQEG